MILEIIAGVYFLTWLYAFWTEQSDHAQTQLVEGEEEKDVQPLDTPKSTPADRENWIQSVVDRLEDEAIYENPRLLDLPTQEPYESWNITRRVVNQRYYQQAFWDREMDEQWG